jgi:pimeloyl-ACP methyl ester carboxylesterase
MTRGCLDSHGWRIAYRDEGRGTPVLFIQGAGVHGDGWLPQTESLRNGYRCITFDNRGIGQSVAIDAQNPLSSLSVDQMAHDVRSLLQTLSVTSAHIVGHSLGGLIALRFATQFPNAVQSLALLCTFADGRQAAPLTWRMIRLGIGTQIGTKAMRRRAFYRLIAPPTAAAPSTEELDELSGLFGHDLAIQPPVVPHQLRAMRACSVTSELGVLQDIPTIILSARHDPIAPPRCGQVIAAGMPHARHLIIDDASHGLPITHAALVNRELEQHFQTAAS